MFVFISAFLLLNFKAVREIRANCSTWHICNEMALYTIGCFGANFHQQKSIQNSCNFLFKSSRDPKLSESCQMCVPRGRLPPDR